jgi:hypothetical protein
MSTTPGVPDLEARLRAALAARADLVRGEDLTPLATVTPLRPRWSTRWVLLAAAAVVLLVLGVVFQGVGSRTRSDEVAPEPDAPRLELPADVGRDWEPGDQSSPARLDLDGDGTKERVEFLAEPSADFDGRVRLQTTLSTTGEQAYGIAELGTTIGTSALDPVDVDDDGDQELVLYFDDLSAVGGGGYPLVFDLREGLLVQAAVEEPELLVRGQVPVPGEGTEHYEMVRVQDYWIEDGDVWSSRSVNAFASGNMYLFRPERSVVDTWRWVLEDDGVLRAEEAGCRVKGPESLTDCAPGQVDDPPVVSPVATETIGVGEEATFDEVVPFSVRIDAGDPPSLVVAGPGRRSSSYLATRVPDPLVNRQQPTAIFSDGDFLSRLMPVGEISPGAEGVRTWLTQNGALVTVVPGADDTWQAFQWVWVAREQMAAFPTGTVCFDDVADPDTARSC